MGGASNIKKVFRYGAKANEFVNGLRNNVQGVVRSTAKKTGAAVKKTGEEVKKTGEAVKKTGEAVKQEKFKNAFEAAQRAVPSTKDHKQTLSDYLGDKKRTYEEDVAGVANRQTRMEILLAARNTEGDISEILKENFSEGALQVFTNLDESEEKFLKKANEFSTTVDINDILGTFKTAYELKRDRPTSEKKGVNWARSKAQDSFNALKGTNSDKHKKISSNFSADSSSSKTTLAPVSGQSNADNVSGNDDAASSSRDMSTNASVPGIASVTFSPMATLSSIGSTIMEFFAKIFNRDNASTVSTRSVVSEDSSTEGSGKPWENLKNFSSDWLHPFDFNANSQGNQMFHESTTIDGKTVAASVELTTKDPNLINLEGDAKTTFFPGNARRPHNNYTPLPTKKQDENQGPDKTEEKIVSSQSDASQSDNDLPSWVTLDNASKDTFEEDYGL